MGFAVMQKDKTVFFFTDYIRTISVGGVNMARLVTQYLYESEAAGVLFPDGFPQGKLCGIALDGASSNMSERVGLGKVLKEAWASKGETKSNIEVNHCAPHRLSLAINSAFSSVDYLHNKFDPFLLDTALWYIQA